MYFSAIHVVPNLTAVPLSDAPLMQFHVLGSSLRTCEFASLRNISQHGGVEGQELLSPPPNLSAGILPLVSAPFLAQNKTPAFHSHPTADLSPAHRFLTLNWQVLSQHGDLKEQRKSEARATNQNPSEPCTECWENSNGGGIDTLMHRRGPFGEG